MKKTPTLAQQELVDAMLGDIATWYGQASQYPETGPTGIAYFRGDLSNGRYVNCLLYRNDEGVLVGILNYFPVDMPPYQEAGDLLILVRPLYRRQGVATKLLREAMTLWPISLDDQTYATDMGRCFIEAFKEK